jgi:predicted RNA-binding Zn-ribbon protein involved in translation (DUF1610 family)
MKIARCNMCNTKVKKETTKELRKEYSFYCPCCGESLYRFETHKSK